MARIRSIKPEFAHSESMGRVSRDARLTFIQLWTLADDEGRLRGNSRMLASLLFPYDDDARDLIDGWLSELERENCVTRYNVDGSSYIQISNWLIHQKIDKPSKSKIPPFGEPSRGFASPRERSSEDLDLEGIKEGKGEESRAATPLEPPPPKKPKSRKTPLPDDFRLDQDLSAYALQHLPGVDPTELFESFKSKALSKGWSYCDWRRALQEFIRNCAPGSGHFAAGQYPKTRSTTNGFSRNAPA